MRELRDIEIALVPGDGAAPEMMEQACRVVQKAALLDDAVIQFVETPMGWSTWNEHGTTLPEASLKRATEIGTLFFGGVGDPELDNTIGNEHPDMRPEAKALLTIRERWGLLLNFRPMLYLPELRRLSPLKPDAIGEGLIEQHWVRFLLEDSYFGTSDLRDALAGLEHGALPLKLKSEVIGDEPFIAELSYYSRQRLEQYFVAAFQYARARSLPVISVGKWNVLPRYVYWQKALHEVHERDFPGIPLKEVLVDAANALLVRPRELHGVILCGNEHGDILSDGAAAMVGGLGLMHSSAVNPKSGLAMFESGAGTAPTLKGKDCANPLGRILTGAMMLDHLGLSNSAQAIRTAVYETLSYGYRTNDLCIYEQVGGQTRVGTSDMAEQVLKRI